MTLNILAFFYIYVFLSPEIFLSKFSFNLGPLVELTQNDPINDCVTQLSNN